MTVELVRGADTERVVWAALCHELRGSLSALCGLTDALQHDGLPEESRREAADLARTHAHHARQVLDWAGDVALGAPAGHHPARVPLQDVVRAAAVATAVPRELLRVRLPGLLGRTPVEGVRVQRVLTNLLDNAARHGPRDRPVRLHARRERGRLHLVVVDEGTTAAPVRRALTAPDPPPGEHGLGLWLVRQVVTAMGGTVRACGRPDGVRVVVDLPAVTVA